MIKVRVIVVAACIAVLTLSEGALSAVIYTSDHQGNVAQYDTTSGSLSLLGTLENFTVEKVMGLAYDPLTDAVIIIDRNARSVYAMDAQTGTPSFLFDLDRELQGGAVKDGLLYGIDEVSQTIEAHSLLDFSDQGLSSNPASLHTHALGVDELSGQLYTQTRTTIDGQVRGIFRAVSDDGTIEDPPVLISQTDFFYNDIDYWDGNFIGTIQGRGIDLVDGITGATSALVTFDQLLSVGLDPSVPGHGIAVAVDVLPQIGMEFNGTAADRVGPGNTASGSDGGNDGVFTITLQAGGSRTVTGIRVNRQAGGSWDTDSGTGFWIVGAARTLNDALFNDPGNASVNFALNEGDSFLVFGSDVDGLLFNAGESFSATLLFDDGSSAETSIVLGEPVPPEGAPQIAMEFNGTVVDRVGPGNTAFEADGSNDGVFTITLQARGSRTVTGVHVNRQAGGSWDTDSGTGFWIVGAARTLDDALFNDPGNASVNFVLNEGDSFLVFGSDVDGLLFNAGESFSATVMFDDGSSAETSIVLGEPVSPEVAPQIAMEFNGIVVDRVGPGNTASEADGSNDGVFTITLQAGGSRTVTGIHVDRETKGAWDTDSGTGFWVVGAARTLNDALFNDPDNASVHFALNQGDRFLLFASDLHGLLFNPGEPFSATVMFDDGSSAETSIVLGNPAALRDVGSQLGMEFNGTAADRVGPGNTASEADGSNDGVFSITLQAGGSRTVTDIRLDRQTGGAWDTDSGTGFWIVGAARTLNDALFNNPDNASVNFALNEGDSFLVFGSDVDGLLFGAGESFSATVMFDDGSSAEASIVLGEPVLLASNHAPTANPGLNQTVNEGDLVSLDGSASWDRDGSSLSYAWTQTWGSPVALSNPGAVAPTFSAPTGIATNEVLTFQLVVDDGELEGGPETVNVIVLSGVPGAPGPGLGNLTYDPDQVFQPIGIIDSPRGHGNVAMVNGYLMVMYSSDGGGNSKNGGIEFWDISNPFNPVNIAGHDNPDTHGLREAHGFGFSNSYGADLMVAQAIEGIQIWDLSNPLDISMLSYLKLPELVPGDYSGAWWTFWQAPFVYVAGFGNGLYIVDASDPRAPTVARHLQTGELSGLSPGLAYAVGNLLVLMEAAGGKLVTMDISNPTDPVLLDTVQGENGYSHLFAAGKILTSGGNGSARKLFVYDVSPEGQISFVGEAGEGLGNGGYGSYQDGIFHSGFSNKYAKIDIAALEQIGTGSSGFIGRDEDFGQVLGNLVFLGEDHGVGSVLIPHQATPDTTAPEVHWVHPPNDATDVVLRSRIGISMSDNVDIRSVDETTFAVRPTGGTALPGKYSVQMGLVNFTPDEPLQPNTSYEVVVDGLQDLVGNASPLFTTSFSTTLAPAPNCALDPLATLAVGTDGNLAPAVVSGTEPITYSWDFGDGSEPTSAKSTPSASHTYDLAGRYAVVLTVQNESGTSSCAAVQIVHNPLTVAPPAASSSIVYSGPRVFNVNPDNDTVSAVDVVDTTKVWEVEVGSNPTTLALAPNGDIWVVNRGDATISILEPIDGDVSSTIQLPFASAPYGIAFSPDGAAAYVTLTATGRLLKLNGTGNIIDDLDVGPSPRGIAISGDSAQILVTRFISPDDRGVVTELDAEPFAVAGEIALAFDPGPDTEASGRGVPNYLAGLAISPDGLHAYVPSKKDNTTRGLFKDNQALTFESTVRTIVSRIDLQTNAEDLTARIDLDDRNLAQALATSPLGDIFVVATLGSNKIEAFDANSGELLSSMNTGAGPLGLVFDHNGRRLYVHNFLARSISVFDTGDLVNGTRNAAIEVAEVPTVADEKLAPQVLLGKRIFYDASDVRMSQDGYLSCASCHIEGKGDARVWDFTQLDEGFRNTIALEGRAGTGHGNLHWSANFDEIQDFEIPIRELFSGTGFMSNSDFSATANPLGAPKAGLSAELDALAAYVSSLNAFAPSPNRNADGSLTGAGELGRNLFLNLGCDTCHSGPTFTDGLRHDVGTIQDSSGLGNGEPLPGIGFETPTLRGIWRTAPYFHDGQAATLHEVLIDHGNAGGLSATELDHLVEYLRQID